MKIIAILCAIFGCTFVDKLCDAAKRAANLFGDYQAQYERVRMLQRALEHVDPYTDWNLFAILKQRCEDAKEELHLANMKYKAARDRAEELINQLKPEEPSHALSDDIDAAVPADLRVRHNAGKCHGPDYVGPGGVGYDIHG